MKNPDLKITKRHLPHFQKEDSLYFITFRTKSGNLTYDCRKIVYNHIRSGNDQYYSLIGFVIMPNHVHLIFQADKGFTLSQIMKGIKGVSSKKINEFNFSSGSVWQEESFDRLIRNDSELKEKLNYMLINPVKWNLNDNGWDYDGWYFNDECQFLT